MDMHYSSNACVACERNQVTCEHSLNTTGSTVPSGCVECANDGMSCFIPVNDTVMMNSGIPTARLGQRQCLRCAINRTSCTFPSGVRPTPCLYCMHTKELWCAIPPPSQPNVVNMGEAAAIMYHNSDPLSIENSQHLCSEQSGECMNPLDLGMYDEASRSFYLNPSMELYPDAPMHVPEPQLSYDACMALAESQADFGPVPSLSFVQDSDYQGDVHPAQYQLPYSFPDPTLNPLSPTLCSPVAPMDLDKSNHESGEAYAPSAEDCIPQAEPFWE